MQNSVAAGTDLERGPGRRTGSRSLSVAPRERPKGRLTERAAWADRRPTVLGIGVDLASVSRFEALVDRYDDGVLRTLFTIGELEAAETARRRAQVLGVCFATKEAIGKALGCGMAGIEWREVGATIAGGHVRVALTGAAARRAEALGVEQVAASWAPFGPDLVLVCAFLY